MVKAELAELVAGAPMNPGDPETRCQYLEKLLGKHGQNFKASVRKLINPRDDDHLTLPPIWSSLFSKKLIYVQIEVKYSTALSDEDITHLQCRVFELLLKIKKKTMARNRLLYKAKNAHLFYNVLTISNE